MIPDSLAEKLDCPVGEIARLIPSVEEGLRLATKYGLTPKETALLITAIEGRQRVCVMLKQDTFLVEGFQRAKSPALFIEKKPRRRGQRRHQNRWAY